MSTLTYAVADSATMLRRDLKHMLRYPSLTLQLMGLPIVFLLLFVYVFGGTLGAGLSHAPGGRAEYLRYVVPGILLMTVAAKAQGTAITVAMDMTEGVIARFRTMAIFRPSVLVGHVLGGVLQGLLIMAVVTGVAVLLGFRPNATGVASVMRAARFGTRFSRTFTKQPAVVLRSGATLVKVSRRRLSGRCYPERRMRRRTSSMRRAALPRSTISSSISRC